MFGIHRLDDRGTVSIFAGILFTVLIAFAGLVTEYGNCLMTQVDTQRVADVAAFSGALAYNSTSSTQALSAAVSRAATLNGIPSADAVGSIVSSPTSDGNSAVEVTVTTTVPLTLSHLLESSNQVTVTATAYAELRSAGSACVIALNTSGTGITLSGGTTLSAPACTVASDNTVTVPCGTSLSTIVLDYDSSAVPSQPCSGITAPSGKSLTIAKRATADPLSGNAGITAAVAHITSVAALTAPTAPTAPAGNSIQFAYTTTGSSSPGHLVPAGCTAAFTSSTSTWTVTCTGAGPFDFGNITTGGGISLNFVGTAAATWNFNGYIYNTGTELTLGAGFNNTYNITQGVQTGGGTTTTFGPGTYNIGPGNTSNCSAGNYSICNTGTTLTFGSTGSTSSSFTLSNGIYNSGGATLSLGTGTSNSYSIGKNSSGSSTGNALNLGGGSATTLADATGVGDVFKVVGSVNVGSGGGSCLTLPAASEHDINGSILTAGGTTLGAGIYTVNGYVALGANGGGDVTCGGSTVGMNGNGVTFVIAATSTPSSGNCAGDAFCLASGYSHVTLIGPGSGNTEQLVVIGPTTSTNTAGATFAEGASNTSLSGAFYLPYGPVTLSGGASVGNGSGQCLEVVASQISLTGGTALATTCTGLGGGGSGGATIALVQ